MLTPVMRLRNTAGAQSALIHIGENYHHGPPDLRAHEQCFDRTLLPHLFEASCLRLIATTVT